MSEGTRTPDRLDHNQELYQLSYAHQAGRSLAAEATRFDGARAHELPSTTMFQPSNRLHRDKNADALGRGSMR